MHIILVPSRLATARSLKITPRLMLSALAGFICLSFATPFFLAWVGIRFNLPFAAELVGSAQQVQAAQQVQPAPQVANIETDEYVRENISSMAVKLGEMQAQVMRLDSLSERLSKLAGVNAPKNPVNGKDAQGGPLIHLSRPLSANELQGEIDRLADIVEQRSDMLTALESQLMERRIKGSLLPTIVPIAAARVGSPYGHRLDPIAGVGAMHEGLDFVADKGTRVVASAGGVVVAAEYHAQYGNLIEIDHGNDFSSRYAHLSSLGVKAGQIVKRGQTIGASGNTGRSTGPHLHFEVRFKGVAQDPQRFLQQDPQLALSGYSVFNSPRDPKAGAPSLRAPARSRATVSFNAPPADAPGE